MLEQVLETIRSHTTTPWARLTVVFASSALIVLLLEPLVIRWGVRFRVLDEPDWRKTHTRAVPCAGGLAFFPALTLVLALVLWLWPSLWQQQYLGLVMAAGLLVVAGLQDDIRDMRPATKLVAQLGAGAILYASGYRLQAISIPFSDQVMELGYLDPVITILGVAAIVNSINMLDGLDGLAAGSAVIMAGFLLFDRVTSHAGSPLLLMFLMGSCLAFLWFNFTPAKVFMGDTGAMFIGLLLAAEVLNSASQGTALTTLMVPLAVLGLPIFDMLRLIVTRTRREQHIFKADKSHFHHRLLGMGLSHGEAVLLIYVLNLYVGMMAVLYKHVQVAYRAVFASSLAIFLFVVFYLINRGNGLRDLNRGE